MSLEKKRKRALNTEITEGWTRKEQINRKGERTTRRQTIDATEEKRVVKQKLQKVGACIAV